MDMILIPGLWLDASTWDEVVPLLEQDGHRVRPLTLPGMTGETRADATVADQVAAVVAEIDAADGDVVLVGHSLGGAIAYAAADARPDKVARVVYVGGEPAGDGAVLAEGWPTDDTGLPFPEWDFFDEEMVADLDDNQRATLRGRALPSPLALTTEPLRLTDERRLDVPATVVTCEYSSAQLREWMAAGEPGAAELARLRDVDYVDLDCGHWPQLTRPAELARVILDAVAANRRG